MSSARQIRVAAPKMLAALKMVRDANGENPYFPCDCMTAINAAIAEAEYEPFFEIIDGDLVEIKTRNRKRGKK